MILPSIYCVWYGIFEEIIWKFKGISTPPANRTARVMAIKYRLKPEHFPASRYDFFATHESFADPNIILRLPTVSLYAVTKTNAIFVQCSKSEHELVSINPFYHTAQYLYATKVIVLSINEFHRVAKLIGEARPFLKANATDYNGGNQKPPIGDVIFLYNIGRCGSTLLTNMFRILPRTISISEPDSYTNLLAIAGSMEEKQKLLYSTTIFESKRLFSKDIDRIIIKVRSQSTPQASIISKIFPNIHLLFMYRNPQPNILSFKRVFGDNLFVKFFFHKMTRWSVDNLVDNFLDDIRPKDIPMYANNSFTDKIKSDFVSALAYSYVGNCAKYLELYSQGIPIKALKYETLLANPHSVFSELCEHIQANMSTERFQELDKIMRKDSQAGTGISRSKKGKGLSLEEKKRVEYVLSFHPVFKQNVVILPGSFGEESKSFQVSG